MFGLFPWWVAALVYLGPYCSLLLGCMLICGGLVDLLRVECCVLGLDWIVIYFGFVICELLAATGWLFVVHG